MNLREKLLHDLKEVGITLDCKLVLKKYSKCLHGSYSIKKKIIYIYVFRTKSGSKLYPYSHLFKTLLHEVTHHKTRDTQYSGVVHDYKFYKLYNEFLGRINK